MHQTGMFQAVLIANRGEIARRVIRTLRRSGIRAVAVHTAADAGAPHVREADEAVVIGSYLDIEAVVSAAVATGAEAIHPGYGFLSENAAFAHACAAAGVVFIGPGERALTVMGDKIRAKEHVAAHGVPVVPGFSGAGMSDDELDAAARETGFPLLVKPSAGGGGKGMQVVRAPAELADAVVTARRVATAAFGDDTLLFERLIDRPRHIEVQVLADAHGQVVSLGERECTLQRRHQKVIEEAPSPIVDAATRERLGAAACAAAASVDYRGAGTVEFLVAHDRPDEFFFIEMNTRLQVEHPVTELVTRIDLVDKQLRIAAGEPLDLPPLDLHGHAVEARVYAESPERGFLPATGSVLLWRAAEGVRTDAAVETGSVVSADYDPMIAKVIAHGRDREEALAALDAALADTVMLGVDTNIAFLRTLVTDADVRAGDMDTGLIERLPPTLAVAPTPAMLRAAASVLPAPADAAAAVSVSPLWRSASGWRISAPAVPATVSFLTDTDELVTTSPASAEAGGRRDAGDAVAAADADGAVWVHANGAAVRLRPLTRREAMQRRIDARDRPDAAHDPEVRSPMPGAVVSVAVADGDRVASGDRLITIEAMKMEHPVLAPHEGTVEVHVAVGDQVRRDQIVVRVSVDDPEPTDHPTTPDPTRTNHG